MAPLLFVLFLSAPAAGPEKTVFTELIERGVSPDGRTFVTLPPPSMADGLDTDAQRQVVAEVAEGRHAVEHLLRDAVVAPFVFRVAEADTGPDGPVIRTIALWFVAHGSLDDLDEEARMERLLEPPATTPNGLPHAHGVVDEEALRARDLLATEDEDRAVHYVFSTLPLLERALVSSTQRLTLSRTEESVLIAGRIAAEFEEDDEYPNQWHPITRTAAGEFQIGPPSPYRGAGFYLKATRLHEPAGALFIELHMAYHEPQGWFGGAPLLRSRLPMLFQDAIRRFRRELRMAGDARG